MSEFINNKDLRKKTIKDIIKQLHEGKSVDEVKAQFAEVFEGVSASEISAAEGALIAEGFPAQEIQKLCDVHASVFKGSIEEIHQTKDPSVIPGHPLQILKLENREIEKMISNIRGIVSTDSFDASQSSVAEELGVLKKISIHYKKKEELLFPYLEKYGISAPPKVMWGVDDEIRQEIKEVQGLFSMKGMDAPTLKERLEALLVRIEEMIFKEENILIPMLIENLNDEEWELVSLDGSEIGFIIDPVPVWERTQSDNSKVSIEETTNLLGNRISEGQISDGKIKLPSGEFAVEELVAMLNTLPMDITFVGKEDEVKYFSEGKERAFPRPRSIIGRNVSNCHPPASVHIVEKIVSDFKAGKKDHEDFWIKAGQKFIFIRYFAVRSELGEYLGVLEVTQDIKPIQEIVGEKRLLSD